MSAESISIAGNGPVVEKLDPFDPNPPKLCPDETGATREGWAWCGQCAAIRPPTHIHGDPQEAMTPAQLLVEARRWEKRALEAETSSDAKWKRIAHLEALVAEAISMMGKEISNGTDWIGVDGDPNHALAILRDAFKAGTP